MLLRRFCRDTHVVNACTHHLPCGASVIPIFSRRSIVGWSEGVPSLNNTMTSPSTTPHGALQSSPSPTLTSGASGSAPSSTAATTGGGGGGGGGLTFEKRPVAKRTASKSGLTVITRGLGGSGVDGGGEAGAAEANAANGDEGGSTDDGNKRKSGGGNGGNGGNNGGNGGGDRPQQQVCFSFGPI